MITVIGASLGAAAAVFKVGPETAVYVGAFGFAFVFTLGSRVLLTMKAVAAERHLHHLRARKDNSTSTLRGYLMLETKLIVFGLKVLDDKEIELNARRAERVLDHFAHAKS
jgi:hypothetical protein